MCTIAGYNGEKQAAPILIDMMRKLEGFDSGFYTGIATYHEGKIYHAKVTGDLDRLLAETDAASLPGTMGFIHSRTPGKAGQDFKEVSHPFTTEADGVTRTALILNGTSGVFAEKTRGAMIPWAEKLESMGYTVKSRHPIAGNATMPDGTTLHSCDVRCQIVSSKIDAGMDTAVALQEMITETPVEGVCLVMSLTEPEAISYARVCMPMHIGFCSHGAYMATAPLTFIDETKDYTLLPPMSYGKVYKNRFEVQPFVKQFATVAPITPQIMKEAYEYMEEKLKTPTAFAETGLNEHLAPMYPKADCTQRATVRYQVVSEFYRQGRLKMETRYIEGQTKELRAPVFYLSLK